MRGLNITGKRDINQTLNSLEEVTFYPISQSIKNKFMSISSRYYFKIKLFNWDNLGEKIIYQKKRKKSIKYFHKI